MMNRVELLPARYLERRKERQRLFAILAGGGALLVALLLWWLLLGSQISSAEEELATTQEQNRQLQASIDTLQEFADLEIEVEEKSTTLATVMAGDVDWPGLMTEIAMVIPSEVWLETLTASAGITEGSTPVGTETAAVRINPEQAFGRVQYAGRSLTMPGVAKWMIRLAGVDQFEAVWLNNAAKDTALGTQATVLFNNTIELNQRAASERHLEAAP